MTAWCDPNASINTLQSWIVALVRAGTYNFLSAVDTCSNLRFNLDFTVCIHSTSPRLYYGDTRSKHLSVLQIVSITHFCIYRSQRRDFLVLH